MQTKNNWHTLQGLKGGDSPDSYINCVAASQKHIVAGDCSGQLVLFSHHAETQELQFECETTGFDYYFDPQRAYDVPRSVTCLEWLNEQKFIVCNEKDIKIYQLQQKYSCDSSAQQVFTETGEIKIPSAKQKDGVKLKQIF